MTAGLPSSLNNSNVYIETGSITFTIHTLQRMGNFVFGSIVIKADDGGLGIEVVLRQGFGGPFA
jgi:hypothetical protein